MRPQLKRSNTWKRFSLTRKDSIRITETQPVRWQPLGVQRSLYDDFSHRLFEWGWKDVFLFVSAAYLAVILAFALLLYLSGCGNKDNFLSGDFPDGMATLEVCFWFSAVNVITTGFGAIVPLSRGAYLLSCLEHFVGLLMSSLLLGIIVSKASLPTSKLVFSKVAIVRRRFGVPHFVVRVGNGRGNFLYSPEIRLSYIRFRHSPEGEAVHTEAHLDVCDPVALKPVFFVQHALNEASPLYGKTPKDLKQENGFIALTISATDDSTLQTLHSRALYSPDDIRWNHTFEDVIVDPVDYSRPLNMKSLTMLSRGIDFAKFHDTFAINDMQAIADQDEQRADIVQSVPSDKHRLLSSSQLTSPWADRGREKLAQDSCKSIASTADTKDSVLPDSASDESRGGRADQQQNGPDKDEPSHDDISKALEVLKMLARRHGMSAEAFPGGQAWQCQDKC